MSDYTSTAGFSTLAPAISNSLSFEYHRGGDRHRKGPCVITVTEPLPYAVIGQIKGTPLKLEIHHTTTTIEPEGAYLIPPACKNRAIIEKSDEARFRWCHVNFYTLGSIDLFSILRFPVAIQPGKGTIAAALLYKLQIISSDKDAHSPNNIILRTAIGFQLLSLFSENSKPTPEGVALSENFSRFKPVLDHIHRNLKGRLTRKKLASLAGLSETRFHAVFSQSFGKAPMEYVQHLRLQRAQALLTGGDLPVSIVAMESGFNDQFHFSRLFKARIGLCPLQYRTTSRLSMNS